MPIDIPDILRSTRADGNLVEAETIVGVDGLDEIRNVGLVSYAADGAIEDSATHIISANIGPSGSLIVPTNAPASIIYLLMPTSLSRNADALSISISGATAQPLLSATGADIAARELTPGELHALLAFHHNNQAAYLLTETLAMRPQDFDMIGAWSFTPSIAPDTAFMLSPAELADPTATVYTTPSLTLPDKPAGATGNFGKFFMGVPEDAPDITLVERIAGSANLVFTPTTDAPEMVNGVQFKWWRVTSSLTYGSTRMYRVHYAYL